MKIDLNINLFNSQKAGNCDSENLVFHIFFYTGAYPQTPQKRQIVINQNVLILHQLNKLKKLLLFCLTSLPLTYGVLYSQYLKSGIKPIQWLF